MQNIRFLVGLTLGILLVSCTPKVPSNLPEITLVSPSGTQQHVYVEIADSMKEQSLGLMGRTSLPKNTGMLFVFKQEIPLNFWMKNTLMPLDIVYFNAQGNYVSHHRMEPCTKDPCPLTPSAAPSAYALEVEAGTFQDWKFGSGWKLIVP